MLSSNEKNTTFQNFTKVRCPVILLPHEIDKILKEAEKRSFRDYMLIRLTLLTGLRNSEVINLNICTVSPFGSVSRILDLPGSIAKGGLSRQIPIRDDLLLELDRFIDSKPARNEPNEFDSPLFVTHKTKLKISSRDFQRITSEISIKVLNRSIYPHVLRHTFATNLLARSNIRVVQQALGHTSLQSTQIYTHPTISDLASAIDQI